MADEPETKKDKESDRWGSYANALLIAIPIILGVTTIAKPDNMFSFTIISIIAGLIAVLCTVLWFARETDWNIPMPDGKKSGLLFIASLGFGAQLSFLIGAFLLEYIRSTGVVIILVIFLSLLVVLGTILSKGKKLNTNK
jgi:hypothetical protein